MSKQDDMDQLLAGMCEDGILEKPRVSDDGNKISYRLKEEYRQHLIYIASHPEILDKPELQHMKPLLEKLFPIL